MDSTDKTELSAVPPQNNDSDAAASNEPQALSPSTSSEPLEWIRMELMPLPGSDHQPKVLFWNPTTEALLGDGSEEVLALVAQAVEAGHLKSATLSHFEITQPLQKPSEFAAILTQHYWVVPQPVKSPDLAESNPALLH